MPAIQKLLSELLSETKEKMEKMSDLKKISFLRKTHLTYTLFLDNDDTFVQFDLDEDGEYIVTFDNYFGDADGVFNLCKFIGLSAKGV